MLELPEETRESTEAMRRVVGDQIKALSELREIIARHGKTLDISSPALGERQAMRQIEAPAMAVGGGEAMVSWSEGSSDAVPATPGARGGNRRLAGPRR